MMATVLDSLGFDAELTPASKDGGKDIILRIKEAGVERTFIVELKHWRSGQHVGQRAVKEFVQVVAREGHERGLFLSTYGFTKTAFSSLAEVERTKVGSGNGHKVVSLCRIYVQAESVFGLLHQPMMLPRFSFRILMTRTLADSQSDYRLIGSQRLRKFDTS
jgi:restriction system protein